MKLSVKVRGFRGIERADVAIDPVALCAGLNYAGKSSLAQAVAAAVCGAPVPFFKASKPDKALLTKTDAKELTRGGMDKGSVDVFADDKLAASVAWPDLACEGTGAVQCSKFAAGLLNVMDLDDDDRQKFFATLLQAMPTNDDLRLALKEAVPELAAERGAELLNMLVQKVEVSGWDPSYTSTKETGARLKGQWEANSQEAYGARKAADWKPKAWHKELDGKPIEAITAECVEASKKWEAVVAQCAVDAAALAELKIASEGEALAQKEVEATKAVDDEFGRLLAGQKIKVSECQLPHSVPCPHCGAYLEIQVNIGVPNVRKAEMSDKDLKLAIERRDEEEDLLRKIELERSKSSKTFEESKSKYDGVKGSTERYRVAQGKQGSQEAVDLARDYLAGLERDKQMIEAIAQCKRLHGLIQQNQKIVDILAPEGLRRQKLVKALAKFNTQFLAVLCGEAKYPAVTLDNELEVLYGGRRYFLLSDSEKYRVKAVLQIAIALYDKSPLVIYDGADILDTAGREGLFAMTASVDINFLVCMTMPRKRVPDISPDGASYWIEQGISYPIGEKATNTSAK